MAVPLQPGQRLGPYEITSQIGEGGMGLVFKAKDSQLGREVALKVLPEGFTADPERLARFEREAKLLASLNHPNIAQIYGLETSGAGGSPALVMELVEGPTLADRLAQGSLPIDECLSIARQIAEALEEAHEKGIVHRDLKPQNVKASVEGKVKVLDFGLAKAMDPSVSAASGPPSAADVARSPTLMNSPTLTGAHGTQLGVILGTAAYMAPEQARGLAADRRADIWAFGVILFEMLAGRRLFEGELVTDVLASVLKHEIDWRLLPAPTPPAARRLLERCLERNPKKRLRDIGDARFELDAAARELVEPASAPLAVASAPRRIPRPWIAATGLALLVTAVAAIGAWQAARVAPPRPVRAFVLPPEKTQFNFDASVGGPVLSPDGTKLVFAAREESGRSALYLRPLDSLAAQPLSGTDDASFPFWSPDSRWVAFFAGGKLRKIDTTGGPPETLCPAANGRGGSWSPSGLIIFAPEVFGALSKVSSAGGEPTALTRLDEARKQTSQRWPAFLPDGEHFVYWAGGPLNSTEVRSDGIFLASLDGGEPGFLFASDSDAVYAPPGYLLYLRDQNLMAHPFDAARAALAGEAFPIAEQVANPQNYRLGHFTVSREGTLAFVTGSSSPSRLVELDASGRQTAEVGAPRSVISIELSPDGKRLAETVLDVSVRNGDLWLVDLARDVRTRFTFAPGQDMYPVWSPDGQQIAYTSSQQGNLDLYLKSSTGAGEPQPLLVSETSKYAADWSPDGKWLAFIQANPAARTGLDIWMLPLAGDRKPVPFLATSFNEVGARFSPDGRWIAYQSNESGRFEIYLTPFPGPGGKWQVSQSGGIEPHWRHDGAAVYFRSPDGHLMEASVRAADAAVEVGSPRDLLDAQLGTFSSNLTVFAPVGNGERFLVLRRGESAPTPITLVTHWTATLERSGPP